MVSAGMAGCGSATRCETCAVRMEAVCRAVGADRLSRLAAIASLPARGRRCRPVRAGRSGPERLHRHPRYPEALQAPERRPPAGRGLPRPRRLPRPHRRSRSCLHRRGRDPGRHLQLPPRPVPAAPGRVPDLGAGDPEPRLDRPRRRPGADAPPRPQDRPRARRQLLPRHGPAHQPQNPARSTSRWAAPTSPTIWASPSRR